MDCYFNQWGWRGGSFILQSVVNFESLEILEFGNKLPWIPQLVPGVHFVSCCDICFHVGVMNTEGEKSNCIYETKKAFQTKL